jgi:Rad3-related DNA helicase
VDEQDILGRIDALVEEEHQLRSRDSDVESDERRARLQRLEETLDQCWDLLRQRRARIEAGQSPDEARARPVDEVEGYLQ